MNTFQTFYRGIIEGGGHINLRKNYPKIFKEEQYKYSVLSHIGYSNGSLTVEIVRTIFFTVCP